MRRFKTKAILKICGTLGEAITIQAVIQGNMPIMDSVLLGLVSAFFLSLGTKDKSKGVKEKVEIDIPTKELDNGVFLKSFQRASSAQISK